MISRRIIQSISLEELIRESLGIPIIGKTTADSTESTCLRLAIKNNGTANRLDRSTAALTQFKLIGPTWLIKQRLLGRLIRDLMGIPLVT